jgi:hypothetical protein
MCNTCGCKAAEDSMVRKHRNLTKKQRQDMQDAVQDVDYMRDKFEAMERFPAGENDIIDARSALEARYPNIEIYSVTYMTKQSGSSNAYHVFVETNEGHFNLYGRIGYGEPKIYGPMSSNQSKSKMTAKAKKGYLPNSMFGAEEVSHNYTPKSYDPLSESPESYDPMSESYSAEEGQEHDYTPESYDPLTESPQLYNPMTDSYSAEGGCGCGNSQCNCAENVLFIDQTGEEAIMDEFIDEGEDYDDAKDYARKAMKGMSAEGDLSLQKIAAEFKEAQIKDLTAHRNKHGPGYARGAIDMPHTKAMYEKYGRSKILEANLHNDGSLGKNAEGRKRRYGKRQRFDHIKGNSRYLARDAKGRWISNVGVSGSIKQDLRSNAKSQQPVGFRGLGDATTKHAEGGVLTNATIQWEDGIGTSSPSSPPYGIHFGAEAYTDVYPQNSAEVDGMTGNGVPVAYGSGSSQYVEPPVRMGAEQEAEEYGTMMTFGEISYEYDYEDIDGMDGSDVQGIMKSVESFIAESGKGEGTGEVTYTVSIDDTFDADIEVSISWKNSYSGINSAEDQSGFTYMHEDFIPNTYGEDSALSSGRGVPQWYGSAEEFEAMEVFPPSYEGDVANSMSRIRQAYPNAQITRGSTPIYMIKRGGSMNRFHVFVETSAGNFNVYGRIGYGNPQIYGPMGQGTYSDKMRTKLRKGYSKFGAEGFENPMIDQGYYPNSTGESSAVISGNGVPQWYGSAETYAAHSHDDDQSVILNKPLETGVYLGFGFMLASVGATVAAVLTGMLLGE